MITEFTTTDNVLGIISDGEKVSFTETVNGVIDVDQRLYDLVLDSKGRLIASNRIAPNYTNNPLAVLWKGRATIYEFQDTTDPETFQTTQKEVPVLVNEPCRLSYNHEQATNIQSGAAVVSQSITLFIRPDLVIKPGSVIEITQHGVTERYKGSGQPAVYCNHQQIILQLYEDNA